MPHQCVRCNIFYEDGSQEILKGCSCGGRLFFYIKKEKLEQIKQQQIDVKLTKEDKREIEDEVREIIGIKEEDTPVVLDFESIHILKPGKYEIDLVKLFQDKPLIFKLEEGKYVVDIAETFQRMRKK